MLNLEQLKNRPDIFNEIDWDMTPEEAVRLYLEWGNNWIGGKHMTRNGSEVSVYFTVFAWEDPPVIYLNRRSMKDAEELARIDIPEPLKGRFLATTGRNRGVYAVDGELKNWLQSQFETPGRG